MSRHDEDLAADLGDESDEVLFPVDWACCSHCPDSCSGDHFGQRCGQGCNYGDAAPDEIEQIGGGPA